MKASMASYKVGDIICTTRTDLSDDWLLCDGSSYSTTLYPQLKNLIISKCTSILSIASTLTITNHSSRIGTASTVSSYVGTCYSKDANKIFIIVTISSYYGILSNSDDSFTTWDLIDFGYTANGHDSYYIAQVGYIDSTYYILRGDSYSYDGTQRYTTALYAYTSYDNYLSHTENSGNTIITVNALLFSDKNAINYYDNMYHIANWQCATLTGTYGYADSTYKIYINGSYQTPPSTYDDSYAKYFYANGKYIVCNYNNFTSTIYTSSSLNGTYTSHTMNFSSAQSKILYMDYNGGYYYTAVLTTSNTVVLYKHSTLDLPTMGTDSTAITTYGGNVNNSTYWSSNIIFILTRTGTTLASGNTIYGALNTVVPPISGNILYYIKGK